MLGREVVEGQQLVAIPEQAFGGLWVFRLEGFDEQIECVKRVRSRFRLPDVMQRLLGLGLGSFGKVVEHVAGLVNPAALLTGAWVDLLQGGPEPHCAVADGEFRGGKPTTFQAEKHFAPVLAAFPHAVFYGQKMLFAPRDHNEHAEPVIGATQAAVDAIRPDIGPFVAAQIGLAPVVLFRRPFRPCG